MHKFHKFHNIKWVLHKIQRTCKSNIFICLPWSTLRRLLLPFLAFRFRLILSPITSTHVDMVDVEMCEPVLPSHIWAHIFDSRCSAYRHLYNRLHNYISNNFRIILTRIVGSRPLMTDTAYRIASPCKVQEKRFSDLLTEYASPSASATPLMHMIALVTCT